MGYERNDRRTGYGYGRDYDRPERAGRYGYDDPQDRGFFERAGDEIRSWFGDEEAERRRHIDERYDERSERDYPRSRYEGGRDAGYRSSGYGGAEPYPRWSRSNQSEGYRGGYARDYAPSSGDFAKPSDIRRTGADYGGGTRPYGYSSYADYGYRYGGGPDDYNWREAEYRALYGGSRDRDDDQYGYRSWRSRQISSLDRDYDEYRRENQSRFESEFSAWRQNRQTQRDSLQKVQEHQEVVGSDGVHVGKVDHVRGDRILLAKSDRDAGGHHHSIPSSWIQSVDEQVHLARTAEQAKQAWRAEDENRLFGRERDDEDRGGTNLNRSFSGTY